MEWLGSFELLFRITRIPCWLSGYWMTPSDSSAMLLPFDDKLSLKICTYYRAFYHGLFCTLSNICLTQVGLLTLLKGEFWGHNILLSDVAVFAIWDVWWIIVGLCLWHQNMWCIPGTGRCMACLLNIAITSTLSVTNRTCKEGLYCDTLILKDNNRTMFSQSMTIFEYSHFIYT